MKDKNMAVLGIGTAQALGFSISDIFILKIRITLTQEKCKYFIWMVKGKDKHTFIIRDIFKEVVGVEPESFLPPIAHDEAPYVVRIEKG